MPLTQASNTNGGEPVFHEHWVFQEHWRAKPLASGIRHPADSTELDSGCERLRPGAVRHKGLTDSLLRSFSGRWSRQTIATVWGFIPGGRWLLAGNCPLLPAGWASIPMSRGLLAAGWPLLPVIGVSLPSSRAFPASVRAFLSASQPEGSFAIPEGRPKRPEELDRLRRRLAKVWRLALGLENYGSVQLKLHRM